MSWKVAPGAGRGKHARLQAAAPESALEPAPGPELRRAAARCGQHAHRRRRDRRGRWSAIRGVDLIAFTGSVAAGRADRSAGRPGPEEGEPRARQRGSLHRIRGRRSRCGRARRSLGPAAQRRPGVHLAEAHVPGGADRRGVHPPARSLRPDAPRSATRWIRRVDIGPLISADALDKVERQIAQARERGGAAPARRLPHPARRPSGALPRADDPAGVRHGVPADDRGDLRPGPPLTVARDADEAIAMANDSRYGLGASIYTRISRRPCGRCRTSRRARSGSTIR